MSELQFPRLLATTSAKKQKEWSAICAALGQAIEFEVLPAKVEFVELQSKNPKAVCLTKALDARRKLGKPALVEDAYFRIPALKDFPGPSYAYVEQTIGNKGLCDLMASNTDRRVFGGITIGFAHEDGTRAYIVCEELEGVMPYKPTGPEDFGWDCLISPIGYNQTLAEMGPAQKNKISMRRKGIESLLAGRWEVCAASESPLML